MAFTKATLHKVESLGLGGTLWCYDTADAAATVDSASYFTGEGSEHIRLGDIILRRTFDSISAPTSITTAGFHIVSAAGAAIDLSDVLAITVTDTD